MKETIKVLGVAAVLFLANISFANNTNPNFLISDSTEKSIHFVAEGLLSNSFEIIFKDETGSVVFSEYSVNPATFERTYNLSELPEGIYSFIIKEGDNVQMLPITIKVDRLEVDLDKLHTFQYAGND